MCKFLGCYRSSHVKVKLVQHDLLKNSQISYIHHTCQRQANNMNHEAFSVDGDMEP